MEMPLDQHRRINVLAETINSLYKAEVIHRRGPWRSFEAVEYATLEWVDCFNHRRLLEPIGNIPPAQAEDQYYAAADNIDLSVTHNPTPPANPARFRSRFSAYRRRSSPDRTTPGVSHGCRKAQRATRHLWRGPLFRARSADGPRRSRLDRAQRESSTDRHRWFVGPRAVLTAAPLPPRGRIKRGVERAMRRWCEQALRSHNLDLTGSVFVPQGANFARAVPLETLAQAA